ncbi:methanogen output domain 1-containing protein [Hippea jasoniae]|uniref:methanogen output domain 1-containing protein n=1 Tax=Hippea jasoniae TaxID=944479 RepID=UPI0005572431|nr:methanogen output domain 1-containing protein [Hippea jasoniae]
MAIVKKEAKEMEKCLDTPTRCVLDHICYKYAAIVMANLIEALDYFGGKQSTKVLRRLLAKNIPSQMMQALDMDTSLMKNLSKEEIVKILPELIKTKGGPAITIELQDNNTIRFTLNECHFMPYSKQKGFCNITAGLMLGFAQMISGEVMEIEEISTIAKGGKQCEFVAKPKFKKG